MFVGCRVGGGAIRRALVVPLCKEGGYARGFPRLFGSRATMHLVRRVSCSFSRMRGGNSDAVRRFNFLRITVHRGSLTCRIGRCLGDRPGTTIMGLNYNLSGAKEGYSGSSYQVCGVSFPSIVRIEGSLLPTKRHRGGVTTSLGSAS